MTRVLVGFAVVSLASLCLDAFADGPRKSVEVWMRVSPTIASTSPGKTVTFNVDHGGLAGVGGDVPVFVLGAPEGTGVMTHALSVERLLVTLALPANAPAGERAIKVFIGNAPPAFVSQEAVLLIRE